MSRALADLRRPTNVPTDVRERQREPEPPPIAAGLTPQLLRFMQATVGNRQVVARLQAGLDDARIPRAIAYVAGRHYPDDLIKQIQTVIGVNPDGDFGPISARAAATWQSAHGLGADGRVGPATLAAMGLAPGGAARGGRTAARAPPAAARRRPSRRPSRRRAARRRPRPRRTSRRSWPSRA